VKRLLSTSKSRAGLVAIAVAAAALLSACLPAPAPPSPTSPTSPAKGFDACAAPSLNTMSTWKSSSPYSVVGIYLGGSNRGCAQPNLNASWVSNTHAQGWQLLPVWVGPQASCSTLGNTTRLPADPTAAWWQGIIEASGAADVGNNLGMGWLTPIYYDMEAYPRGGACSVSVQAFADGWVRQLNARGYLGGMYSSLCSGILDAAMSFNDATKAPLNGVWIAAWNNTPNILGFGSPCALSDSLWNNHQRVHQYIGGHNESYGGITINIDTNAVDGLTG
jgi:hypothetical protein